MKIHSIQIENFRNIDFLKLDFDNVNIIYGENAQGKTNLLEAIYLFTGAKSFRGVKDKEMVRFGQKCSKLQTEFESQNRSQTAEILIKGKRSATLNGIKKNTPSVLGEEMKAVIFSPVHLSMIKDGPAERRKFTDHALCQLKVNYRNLLREYNRCLVQRNMLLKENPANGGLFDLLGIWDRNLAKSGAKIIYQRQKYMEALLPYAREIFEGISMGKESMDLKVKGEFDYSGLKKEEIEQILILTFEKKRDADLIMKTTSAGPHRDDIEIFINGHSAKTFASQGQQRSCVLALKLAEACLLREMTQEEPIALLDDVMSELDKARQDYILNHIKNWQIFITCCDADAILRLKQGKTFHIIKGGLS